MLVLQIGSGSLAEAIMWLTEHADEMDPLELELRRVQALRTPAPEDGLVEGAVALARSVAGPLAVLGVSASAVPAVLPLLTHSSNS